MKVILHQPEIPQNAGNIARTCAVTGSELVLIKPLGFKTCSRLLKRAGLDYWDSVQISYREELITYLEKSDRPFYFFSSKSSSPYTDISFTEEDLLVFGSESAGLPPIFHQRWPERFHTIPMKKGFRSLNLSNSVAIVLYEALRQQNFSFLQEAKNDLTAIS